MCWYCKQKIGEKEAYIEEQIENKTASPIVKVHTVCKQIKNKRKWIVRISIILISIILFIILSIYIQYSK